MRSWIQHSPLRGALSLSTIPISLTLPLPLLRVASQKLGPRAVLITKGVGGEFEAAIRHAAAADPSLGDLPARLQAADSILSRAEAGNNTAAMRWHAQRVMRLSAKLTTRRRNISCRN